MLDEERERRIRERAYRIWEEEGRPDGRAEDHWGRAHELVAQETGYLDTLKPVPSGLGNDGRAGEPVEPTEAIENQGDFPSLTDQSETSDLPRRREAPARARTAVRR